MLNVELGAPRLGGSSSLELNRECGVGAALWACPIQHSTFFNSTFNILCYPARRSPQTARRYFHA
jgi:hypothetical protein